MYNENDLKTIYYAYKGGIKKYQLAQLMGLSESDCFKMLECARKKYGSIKQEKELPGMHRDRRAFFHRTGKAEEVKKPIIRPTAKYDNKSSEERIEELLNADL